MKLIRLPITFSRKNMRVSEISFSGEISFSKYNKYQNSFNSVS